MEDDDREVGWAPRRIRALEGQVEHLTQKIEWVQESGAEAQRNIEGQVERMSENFTQRLDGLEKALEDRDRRVAPARVTIDEFWLALDRIADLEKKIAALGVRVVVDPDLPEGMGDFSPPIGGGHELKSRAVIPVNDEDCFIKLSEAEARVRRHMEGHFLEVTIRGVVQALRGER